MIVDILVEGPTDEIALTRILSVCSLNKGTTFGRKGISEVRRLAPGLARRAVGSGIPLLVLVDLIGSEEDCIAHIPHGLAPHGGNQTLVRVAVKELESWLLADSDALRSFFAVGSAHVPDNPEAIPNPKQAFFEIARRARTRRIREGLIRERQGALTPGPDYLNLMEEFLSGHWSPSRARPQAPSLNRCMIRLAALT